MDDPHQYLEKFYKCFEKRFEKWYHVSSINSFPRWADQIKISLHVTAKWFTVNKNHFEAAFWRYIFPKHTRASQHAVCHSSRNPHSKICGNYSFPQNFHIGKLGEISVFYTVPGSRVIFFLHKRIYNLLCNSISTELPQDLAVIAIHGCRIRVLKNRYMQCLYEHLPS